MIVVTWLQLLLIMLATYRLSILVARDTFPFGPARDWLVRNYTGSLTELVQCPWCLSMWFAAGLTALTFTVWGVWLEGVEVVLAASGVAGFLSEHS